MREHLPAERQDWTSGNGDADTRDLVRRFTEASVATDIETLSTMLRDDVRCSMPPTPGLDSFYWEHSSARVALRVYFRADAPHAVVGFNALGLRLRHAVCEQWIEQQTPVGTVLAHLGAANFDPEFTRQHEPAIVADFNRQFPRLAVALKQRKGLFARF